MLLRVVTDNADILQKFFCLKNFQRCDVTKFLKAEISAEKYLALPASFWQQCFQARITIGFRDPTVVIKAVFFDMDGTVVREESIDELSETADKTAQIADLTSRAMSGKLPFPDVYRRRIEILQDVSESDLFAVGRRLHLHDGVQETLAFLRDNGIIFYLVSSGFYQIVRKVCASLNFEACLGNTAKFKDGLLTMDDKSSIIDSAGKRAWVLARCEAMGCSTSEVAVVGDGANDIGMMRGAGVAVGFDPHAVLVGEVSAMNFSGDHRFLIPLLART